MPPLIDAQRDQLTRHTAILRAVDGFYADLETVEPDPGNGWPPGGTHRVAAPRPAAVQVRMRNPSERDGFELCDRGAAAGYGFPYG